MYLECFVSYGGGGMYGLSKEWTINFSEIVLVLGYGKG